MNQHILIQYEECFATLVNRSISEEKANILKFGRNNKKNGHVYLYTGCPSLIFKGFIF